jgi:hypothetical protein
MPAMEHPFRKKRLSQIGLLAGFGLLLPAAGVADAASIIQSQGFSLFASPAEVSTHVVGPGGKDSDSDSDSTTVTFDQFDPALGTLTEIDIGINSTIARFLIVSASPAELFGPVSAHADWDASGQLTMPDFSFSFTDSFSVNCSATDTSCSQSDKAGDPLAAGAFLSTATDLADYTGTGTVSADLDLALTVSVTLDQGDFGNASAGGSATWDPPFDGITVTYIYTPVTTVPEPGSLALLGAAGLAGLGLSRRRTKNDT